MIWVVAALPLLTLTLGLVNLLSWPRGRKGRGFARTVSALIPARNEVENLEPCLRALAASGHPLHEIIVYDDASTDGTGALLERLRSELPALRVVQGVALPEGWVGKPHACHRLAEAATGDVLFFLDADVRLEPGALERAADLFERLGADLVTAVPAQMTGSFFERLVVPLLHLTYVSWFPLALTWRSRDVRFLAANGQLLFATREAYLRLGGFESVRAEIVDDMALCRRAKALGLRVVFADGLEMASCRMYRSSAEVVRGFSKNLYEGIGANHAALLVVLGLYVGAFVAPYAAWGLGLFDPAWRAPGGVGVGANVLLRLLLALRYRQPPEGVVLHPLAVLALVGIAVNSARWQRRDRVEWRGRAYRAREQRVSHG